MQKIITFMLVPIVVIVMTGCASLTSKQKQRYEHELKETKDLTRAIAIYKKAPLHGELEKQARLRIIVILRDYELPDAKTADDFLALHGRLPWTMGNIKNRILICAINRLDNEHEIGKILQIVYPKPGTIYMLGYNKIQKIKSERQHK